MYPLTASVTASRSRSGGWGRAFGLARRSRVARAIGWGSRNRGVCPDDSPDGPFARTICGRSADHVTLRVRREASKCGRSPPMRTSAGCRSACDRGRRTEATSSGALSARRGGLMCLSSGAVRPDARCGGRLSGIPSWRAPCACGYLFAAIWRCCDALAGLVERVRVDVFARQQADGDQVKRADEAVRDPEAPGARDRVAQRHRPVVFEQD